MTEYDACEQAYKHGYEDGYSKAIRNAYEYILLKFHVNSAYNKCVHTSPGWKDFCAAIDSLPGI